MMVKQAEPAEGDEEFGFETQIPEPDKTVIPEPYHALAPMKTDDDKLFIGRNDTTLVRATD